MTARHLFLASQSPRRQEILTKAGIPFQCIPNALSVEPARPKGVSCTEWVVNLARMNVEASKSEYEGLIVGSDTMVVLNDRDFGKPSSKEDAVTSLLALSGNTHQVLSSLAILDTETGQMELAYESVDVTFKPLTEEQVRAYIEAYDVMDKAGAYGIQHEGAGIVKCIDGSYFAVMGFPLQSLCRFLVNYDIL